MENRESSFLNNFLSLVQYCSVYLFAHCSLWVLRSLEFLLLRSRGFRSSGPNDPGVFHGRADHHI